MDHSRLKKDEWDLIKHLKVKDAYITKAWEDTEGNIHMELTYEPSVSSWIMSEFLNQDARRANEEAYKEETKIANSILRKNRP